MAAVRLLRLPVLTVIFTLIRQPMKSTVPKAQVHGPRECHWSVLPETQARRVPKVIPEHRDLLVLPEPPARRVPLV